MAGSADHKQPLALGSFKVLFSNRSCTRSCFPWGSQYPGTDLWGVPKASHFDSLRDNPDLPSVEPPLHLPKAFLGLLQSLISLYPVLVLAPPFFRCQHLIKIFHPKLCSVLLLNIILHNSIKIKGGK